MVNGDFIVCTAGSNLGPLLCKLPLYGAESQKKIHVEAIFDEKKGLI